MESSPPLVTIGIPTYNRSTQLLRAITSAQKQTYNHIEIIVSDNGSTDDTEAMCRELANHDQRIQFFRQPTNLGGTGNFNWVLSMARGSYFMWLGDDDWIESNYVESCLNILHQDAALALVSGLPVYCNAGVHKYGGRIFDADHVDARHRITRFLFKVTDNGAFYGVFRKDAISDLQLSDKFAGDWYFVCDALISGTFRMTVDTHIHRELGGATESYKRLTKLYSLPWIARLIPSIYAARSFKQHLIESKRFQSLQLGFFRSTWLFVIILTRPLTNIPYRLKRKLSLS
ncbi:glycosyltransferase family 2 protein [Hydrogenophaga sp. R2]|uniref:glycosyltransferase family 2 protein n=1 Tax=Hydrogenophaga sp. R2 TaxID=3132827 RepID=UPI003CECC248